MGTNSHPITFSGKSLKEETQIEESERVWLARNGLDRSWLKKHFPNR